MKKSFVLQTLKNNIDDAFIADSTTLANILLHKLEDLGMLPPGVFIDYVDGKPLLEHVWEAEDENS